MRISDWSSDVCSSDLIGWLIADAPARAAMLDELLGCFLTGKGELRADFAGEKGKMRDCLDAAVRIVEAAQRLRTTAPALSVADDQIGRAPCRARVGKYASVSGVAVTLYKTKPTMLSQRQTI